MSPTEKESIENINKLSSYLETQGVNVSLWGKGEAKTVENFYREIERGESVLREGEDGELLRELVVCGANVFYTSPEGKRLRLREEKQVFYDGRVRYRDYGHAVSEKILHNEEPKEGIYRGIREELGIEGNISLRELEHDEIYRLSPSYPDLMTHYIRFHYEAELNEEQFNQEGYVEHGSTSVTYFIWEEVE